MASIVVVTSRVCGGLQVELVTGYQDMSFSLYTLDTHHTGTLDTPIRENSKL